MKKIPVLNVIQGLQIYAYAITERWPNMDGRPPAQCWQEDGLSELAAKKKSLEERLNFRTNLQFFIKIQIASVFANHTRSLVPKDFKAIHKYNQVSGLCFL